MLVELRRKFDEVASRRGAGESGILGVREHAVQRVPELVEHGSDVGEADQSGFAFGRLGQVGDVVNDRKVSQQARLADE